MTWSVLQMNNAYRYGVCAECGSPREWYREDVEVEEFGGPVRVVITTGIRCPNGHRAAHELTVE